MKVIYIEETLQLLANSNRDNPEYIKNLLATGQIKETEGGIKYLIIQVEDEV